MGRSVSLAFFVLLALGVASPAQDYYTNEYEMRYGEPVDVSIEDLLHMPESYSGRTVRTTGTLDVSRAGGGQMWSLRGLGGRVIIIPVREARGPFDSEGRRWLGRDIEVTGVVEIGQDPERQIPVPTIMFWSFFGPPEDRPEARRFAKKMTLEELVTRPGQQDGQMVRVVGQFRGHNLYGDLPSASRRRSSDWVIKNDLFAVWVTDKKPKGRGWSLDAKMRRDTGKWLEVEGQVRTFRGIVYIAAADVVLTEPPSETAKAAAPPPLPPPPPPKPPVVVFSLPLDGERDVPPDSVFKVQFSKDMDETSFEGRVVLRYAGRPRPGDRALDAVSVEYDLGRRALTVDPGDLLRAGRTVELLLLPGIVDLDGLPLEPRPDHDPGGAADVLRFQIAGGLLLSGPSP